MSIPPSVRRAAPRVAVALLFVAALYALRRLLEEVRYAEVITQFRTLPPATLAASFFATAASYLALNGYDWSALRYVGRRVPWRRMALASFCGFALGNTIGLGVISGGAVRYRIYSAVGLDAGDIARIALFCGVSFALGVTVVGLGAAIFAPGAVVELLPLSVSQTRFAAIGALALASSLLLAGSVRGRSISLGHWAFRLPGVPLLGAQVLFSTADIVCAGAALYTLLPRGTIPFIPFLALFAIAAVAGVVSNVPGGLGVFEGVLLVALGHYLPPGPIAVALLGYRAVYYLVPFILALILLAGHELLVTRRVPVQAAVEAIAPFASVAPRMVPVAMAGATLVAGTLMTLKGVVPFSAPEVKEIQEALPLSVVELSNLTSSMVGVALIMLAPPVMRRIRAAYWILIATLVTAAGLVVLRALDYDLALLFLLLVLLLAACHREFYRRSRLSEQVLSLDWTILVLAIVAATTALLFFAHKSVPYANDLWWRFAFDAHASRALRAELVGTATLTILLVTHALRPPRLRPSAPSPEVLQRAEAILRQQDDPDANYVLLGDKTVLFSHSQRSFLMYAVQGRSWIALRGPIGDPEEAPELIWKLEELADRQNGRAAFYQVPATHLPLYVDAGFTLSKLGEEAVVSLPGWSLDGRERKHLRYALSRGEREGLNFEIIPRGESAPLMEQLTTVSDRWLSKKRGREKGFSLGTFRREYLDRFPIAVVREGQTITAFANLFTTDTKEQATIDLMRHLPDGSRFTMEFLFTHLILALQAEGHRELSLGMAPLSGLSEGPNQPAWNRLGAFLYRHAGHFYNFEGLRRFKEKFDPEWRPRYLATIHGVDPLLVLKDVMLLTSGGLRGVVTR